MQTQVKQRENRRGRPPETPAQPTSFSRLLVKKRLKLGWSLMQAAEETGLAFSYLSRLERGRYSYITVDTVARLASAYKLPLDRLFKLALSSKTPKPKSSVATTTVELDGSSTLTPKERLAVSALLARIRNTADKSR